MEKNFGEITNLKALFDEIPNKLPSGEIDFDEFCDWAIIKSFKYRGLYVEAVESNFYSFDLVDKKRSQR